MTWLGKILTVLVLLLSLVWVWFTAQVYATRTNWKGEADRYKKGYEEIKAARDAEYRANNAERSALLAKVAAAEKRVVDADEKTRQAEAASAKSAEQYAELNKRFNQAQTNADTLQANLGSALSEVQQVRALNTQKEKQIVDLVLAKEKAESDRTETIISRDTFKRRAEQLEAQQDSLRAQLDDLRQNGGRAVPSDPLRERAAPIDPLTRGTITRVEGGLVTINIGEDAGVTKNAELDVYRLDKGGAYIGSVRVLDTAPKHAVAQFVPPPGRTRPRPDEMPKVGDQVGKLGAISAVPR